MEKVSLQSALPKQFNPAPEEDSEATCTNIPCMSHSAVLTYKPLLETLDKMPSHLVRLAHVLENSRAVEARDTHVHNFLDQAGGFIYLEVAEMPAECIAWRAEHSRLLELCRPARDMSVGQETFCLDADTGSWLTLSTTHHCVRGSCPLGCGGDARVAKRLVKLAHKLMAGGNYSAPLAYRWKGFDRAVACVIGHSIGL